MSTRPYRLPDERKAIQTEKEAQKVNDEQMLKLLTTETLLAAALEDERLITEFSMQRTVTPGADLDSCIKVVQGSSTIAEALRICHTLLKEVLSGMDAAGRREAKESLEKWASEEFGE